MGHFYRPTTFQGARLHPDLPDAPPLPLPSLSDRGFPQLLTFLHSHLDSHIRAVQHADTFDDIFATFVAGPQDHHNAGAALHSHLVGCATTDPSTHHLALYVPVGPESPYKGPSDWAPLMVYLATSFLYPDLPFLVCSPDYVLGAQASIDELRRCLGFSSTLNLFTTHTSLVGSDVLVHLPYPCQFSSYIAPRDPELPPLAPFSYRSPSEVLELISSVTKTHMATQAGIHTRIASGSVYADLYYALYCTPYYGFSPDTSADFLVMAYQLSSFLVHCCYTSGGAATSALEDELNSTPEDLLTVLASAYKQWTSLHPGQGVFIGPLTADTATLRPFPMAWLYSVDESSPAPPVFGRLSDVFSAGNELYTSPLFQGPICLGPAASLHLNPILLDPPYLGQSSPLQLSTSLQHISWGAIQYHHSLHKAGNRLPLHSLQSNTHSLPDNFLLELLEYEGWSTPNDLFLIPNNSTYHTDTSTLSIWCPDQDTAPSPSHSITLCCGAAYSDNAASHGPTFGYRDWQARLAQGKGWRAWISHTPQFAPLSILFFRLIDYWTGFLHLDREAFAEPVFDSFTALHSTYRPGIPAWSLPPHTLAHNLFCFLYTIFYRSAHLIEGFGAGAFSAAVAATLSLAPPKTSAYSSPDFLLAALGGIAMHPPTFSRLIQAFASVHSREVSRMDTFLAPRPERADRPSNYVPPFSKHERPEFKTALLLVQHVHDRVSPWTLSPLLLSYLYNLGIKVLTLHDDIAAQQDYASLHNRPFVPFSHFGSTRHDYERVVPTLKTFSASTFFTNFLEPLTYEQLEAREGSLGSTYCPDLLDLLLALFTYLGTPPTLLFGAQADALPQTLIHGCHRPPAVTTTPLFPSSMDLHESPANFYTRVFLHSLRLPSLRLLGLPSDNILAVEDALKQSLLSLPLPQALDVLHTQLLSCICVSTPRRETSAPGPNQGAPPIACYLCPVDGSRTTRSPPPVFRCWIGRKVSPNMAILDFKCDSLPWAASYIKGTAGRSLFGLSPGNFIQLVFPTTEQFLSDAPYFGLALYLTSVTTKGRVLEEQPEEQTDSGGSQVTQFSGILLPFLKSTTQSGTLIHQMHLPLFAKREQLHELVTFPPLDMARTFYMPLSSPRGLFSELLKVPFYRIPKTLGWPFLDSPMPSFTPPSVSLQPLHNLLSVLPYFLPSQVRSQIPPEYHIGTHPAQYSLNALSYLVHEGILPGTQSDHMHHTYEWPLDWSPRVLESPEVVAMQSSMPETYALLTSLGATFLKRLTHALLARDGHFSALLLSAIWGLSAGHTSLCVQGIFGSGKTYNSSLLVVILSTVLGLPTLISSEPNLPLATAADTICDLLQDAPSSTLQQYARCLAGSLTATTPIDYLAADRAQLFKEDSPLKCLILTHGFALRHLCQSYSPIPTFISRVRLSIIDEGQQGGQAGFTALAANLPRSCLQLLTEDSEQTRAGTGGDPLKEALLHCLAQKSIGFLGGPGPRLPAEMLHSFTAALRTDATLKPLLPTDPSPTAFDLLEILAMHAFPVSLCPSSVREAEGLTPTAGVLLHLILPHSLRCPADTYYTQVSTHYPHLHRPLEDSIAYGHYEDPTPAQAATRQCIDMQGNLYHCSGYRLLHWTPSMRTETHMQTSSRTRVLEIAATISYFTARNIRLDTESSKLLILSPHNDTITDLEDVLGAPDADLPPTLYDFYLVTLFRLHFLASRLDEFPKRNHNNQEVTPHPNSITNLAIFANIKDNAPFILELETLATLPVIISLAIDFPRYFTSYCTLSNTVKAIGIGGTASLFLSVKMSRFLADSKEAEARNLVALTRSKGLCVVLLPFTDKFPSSALHSLRTLCGYRHGIFTVGSAPLNHSALAEFLSQPDTVLDDVPYTYDATSWQVAHQLTSFGNWILLPMVIGLSYGSATYFFPLTIRDQIPGSNNWQLAAENFEWHGTLPGHPLVILSFAQNSLTLTAQKVHIARFPYPSPNTRSNVDSLEPPGWTMFPAPGSYFFAAASLSRGHVHPVKPLVIDPTDYPLPPLLIRWPQTSPGKASNLPLATPAEMFPVPGWLSQAAKALFEKGPAFLASSTCLVDENLVVRDWLPAYCAHTIPGFGEDHLLTIVAPEVISAFGSRVASPLLDGEQGVALDYLKSVLDSAEEPYGK